MIEARKLGGPLGALAKLPYDSFTLDLQHSLIDRGTAVHVLQALSLGQGVAARAYGNKRKAP